jgi:hypothetical protein
MKLTLVRDYHGDDCTMGTLAFSTPGEDFVCQTMERPWIAMPGYKGGLSGKSCVPRGIYNLEVHRSEQHPHTWALVNPDLDVIHYEDPRRPSVRALVLIHIANYARELRGCIAPGRLRTLDGEGVRMVAQSRVAMIDIQRLVPWTNEHTLEIR